MSVDWVRAIASGAGLGLTVALMSALMAMRHDRAQMEDGRKLLTYGVGFKVIAAIALVSTASLAVAPFVAIFRDPSRLTSNVIDFIITTAICWVLACIAALPPAEIFFRKISYNSDGVYISGLRRGTRFVPWNEISEYHDNGINSPFLRLRQGQKIKVWRERNGFPEFLAFVKDRRIPGSEWAESK